MSTPREVIRALRDTAKRVAEDQLDEIDAVASMRSIVRENYPELPGSLVDGWIATELYRRIRAYEVRRDKKDAAAIARTLAKLGQEQPFLDGTTPPVDTAKKLDRAAGLATSTTLAVDADYVSGRVDSAWRLVESAETLEEQHECRVAAVDGNLGITRAKAEEVLNQTAAGPRRQLEASVRATLAANRSDAAWRRYGLPPQAQAK